MITHIILENFKNVSRFDADLGMINVLVGANNSGKSSVLQGIHFSILAEVVRRSVQRDTISQNQLLYVPSSDFTLLRHGSPYSNYSGNTSSLDVTGEICEDDVVTTDHFKITISKGRNFENISIKTSINNAFRQLVTSPQNLFSIYVPGLSGVPLQEKLNTRAVIRSATANGDANLYLRNILFYINETRELNRLNALIQKVFPNQTIELPYDSDRDIFIQAVVRNGNDTRPLELCGTGFLQIAQIMAYVLLFKPKLLLLDEPDEHLHPNNQLLLSEALIYISDEMGTQILLCTHSRHMLSYLNDDAKMIWMKDGQVVPNNASASMYSILVDIGALDSFDKVINGAYSCVVLTEDKKVKLMKRLLEFNGFDMNHTLVVPYKGCSNIEAATQLADFIHRNAPNCKIIIHRDRDFMTDEEVAVVEQKIAAVNIFPFITSGSDIEAYFVNPAHLARLLNIADSTEIDVWENELAQIHHVDIQDKFSNKRDDIKFSFLYRDNREACPHTIDLFSRQVPTPPMNRLGKFMLKKIRGAMYERFEVEIDPIQDTPFIHIERLQEILGLL